MHQTYVAPKHFKMWTEALRNSTTKLLISFKTIVMLKYLKRWKDNIDNL